MLRLLLGEPPLLQRLLRLAQHPQDERVLRPLVKVAPGVVRERLDDFPKDGHLEERGDVPLRLEVGGEDALLELNGAGLRATGVVPLRCLWRSEGLQACVDEVTLAPVRASCSRLTTSRISLFCIFFTRWWFSGRSQNSLKLASCEEKYKAHPEPCCERGILSCRVTLLCSPARLRLSPRTSRRGHLRPRREHRESPRLCSSSRLSATRSGSWDRGL